MKRVLFVGSLFLLQWMAVPAPASAQYGRTYPGSTQYPGSTEYPGTTNQPGTDPNNTTHRQTRPGGKQNTEAGVLPAFDGVVRGLDKKLLTLERPDANTMEFHCSKKTSYYDGTRKIKISAIKDGDPVLVEAKRAPDGSLDAVNIRLNRKKSS
jgi:hypothetical protein